MALVVKDRVRETSTSTGTGTITLNGAVVGFQSFTEIGDANTTYYTIVDAATGAWEVGIGTYTASGTTLSRDTILESSTGGTAVNFAAGTKDVFVTYPAERSVYVNGSTITPATAATLPVVSGGTGASTLTGYVKGTGTSALTASATIPNSDISGLGTMSTQNANSVAVTGGTIDGTTIGGATPAAVSSTNLAYTGTLTGGTGIINIGSGQVYKDASGNLGVGNTPAANTRITVRTAAVTDALIAADNGVNTGFKVQFANNTTSIGNDFNNPLVFLTNNTERLRLDSSGNLGLGTASPGAKLDVFGNAIKVGIGGTANNATGVLLDATSNAGNGSYIQGLRNGSPSYLIGDYASAVGSGTGFINFNYGSTAPWVWQYQFGGEQMRLNSTGLGIGTSSPAYKLDVRGVIAGGNGTIIGGISYSSRPEIGAISNHPVGFITNNTTQMLLDTSGNLGVGTTAPTSYAGYKSVTVENSTGGVLVLRNTGNTANLEVAANSTETYIKNVTNTPLTFGTNNTEKMRITSAGRLGIGTTAPSSNLSVYTADTYAATFNTGITTLATTRISLGGFSNATGGEGGSAAIGAVHNHSSTALSSLAFYTHNGSTLFEAARIDSSGNLGLGVTPSAWNVNYKPIEIGRVGNAILGGVAGSSMEMMTNVFVDSVGNYKYANNGAATDYYQFAGAHIWYNAPSGTAGNAISFTQAMTLDVSGNLGIGTASPAAKLHIGGVGSALAFDTTGQAASNTISTINSFDMSLYCGRGSTSRVNLTSNGDITFANSGTEKMRLNSSGKLMLGTDVSNISPGTITLTQSYGIEWNWTTGASYANIFNQASSAALVLASGYQRGISGVYKSSTGAGWAKSAISIEYGAIKFFTDDITTVAVGTDITPSERARIDSSGSLLVGTTSANGAGGLTVSPNLSSGSPFVCWNRTATGATSTAVAFRNGGTDVGLIQFSNTATSYITSSDYRLKENVAPMTGALDKVAQLKPCTYTWKADGSAGQGFIAHELQAVVPDCVTGTKDAEDKDGKPQYQGVDTSFLVATIVAALQEQQAMFTELKAEFDAYKLSHP
jgi:hypothetical protein